MSFSDKRLSPYIVSGDFNGDLNLTIQREINAANPLGYSLGFNIGADKLTLSPSLWYQLTEGIKFFGSMSVDSELGVRANAGLEYEFSQETKVTVQYQETVQNLTELQETFVVLQLQHMGYALKFPIYGHTKPNAKGEVFNLGLFTLANLVAYKCLKYKQA